MQATVELAKAKTTNNFPQKYGMYYDAADPSCILIIGGDNKTRFILWGRASGPSNIGFEHTQWIRCPKGTVVTLVEDEE